MLRAGLALGLLCTVCTVCFCPPAAAQARAPGVNSDGSPKQLPPPPPDVPGRMMVLDYFDFGPQAMAFPLLGMAWWQWADCACFEPGDEMTIRVVVYRGVSKRAAQRRYPVVKNQSDYRHVSYRAALRFLDEQLADLGDPSELPELRAELAATRRRILAGLARPR
ncbi:MAG: hypothetical protein IT370_03915 [Deltaproteobacteria bacterium]|nr:hypothetical protein [Deltaproteobacteria bacterium]